MSSNKKDYYDILGVSKTSSESDIKQAYRKLAREHHPDMVKDGDKNKAEERFKEINEAYQILSDPQKRKMYDQFGHAGMGNNGAGGFGGFGGQNGAGGNWGPFSYSYSSGAANSGFGDVDPFDVFEEFFGFRGYGGNRQPRKGKNLYYEMYVPFVDAVVGAEKNVKIEGGEVKVRIPAGIRDGNEMRFTGKGMAGPNGVPNGDLFITFRVEMPKEFERYDDNLLNTIEIDFVQAALGDVVEVNIVDSKSSTGIGKGNLKIPAGTQSGVSFRLKDKGMPRLGGKGNGDVVVQVFVKIPTKLSKKQKELLEQFKKS